MNQKQREFLQDKEYRGLTWQYDGDGDAIYADDVFSHKFRISWEPSSERYVVYVGKTCARMLTAGTLTEAQDACISYMRLQMLQFLLKTEQ